MNIKKIKRSLNQLQQLRRDTKSMVPMEMYKGIGDVLIRTYSALHQQVLELINDPFVEALRIELPEDATDRQKATLVNLLVGQLMTYVEGIYEDYLEENRPDGQKQTEDDLIRQRFNNMMDGNDI